MKTLFRKFNWFDFDIPADYLVRGPNEVVLHLSSAAKENDDRLVVGIDMFEDQGYSTRSTDGGVTWFARPLNKNGFSGEYMIRIVLVTEEADSKNLTLT